jgi:[CysO sulfur-carrier protein]-S-L-cysteine hydrolase
MRSVVRIQAGLTEQLLTHAQQDDSQECCGLLAGRDDVIARVFPALNALASATAYEIAPQELFHLVRELRAANLELLGIYHSHPTGENKPSQRDIERAYYPDAAYFIISPRADASHPVRAFSIVDGRVSELEIQIVQT